MPDRKSPLYVAKVLFKDRFHGAEFGFLAGSVVRGEASAFSDIDLVVVYPQIKNAYRESFVFKGWPVEVFVHDFETIQYFLETFDRNLGRPELHQMLLEAIVIPTEAARALELKSKAKAFLDEGPPKLSDDQLRLRKYRISEILDDLRAPRSRDELFASLSLLYHEFGDFFFRSQGHWSARGKAIPRLMKKVDLEFYKKYVQAVDYAIEKESTKSLVELCESFIGHPGGYFEGFREDAPSDWRVKD